MPCCKSASKAETYLSSEVPRATVPLESNQDRASRLGNHFPGSSACSRASLNVGEVWVWILTLFVVWLPWGICLRSSFDFLFFFLDVVVVT